MFLSSALTSSVPRTGHYGYNKTSKPKGEVYYDSLRTNIEAVTNRCL
jgi:hypothetical protein